MRGGEEDGAVRAGPPFQRERGGGPLVASGDVDWRKTRMVAKINGTSAREFLAMASPQKCVASPAVCSVTGTDESTGTWGAVSTLPQRMETHHL